MINESELRDALSRQAESYEVPPLDLMSLRAAAQGRRRDARLWYGGIAAAGLLAVGVAWGQLGADQPAVQPTDRGSDVMISPSCFPPGAVPPVPDSPWAGDGFVSGEPVWATLPVGRSCTLVLRYGFHRFGAGLSGMVFLYSDGRLIIDTANGEDWFVQWERRLTPAGVERLRTAVVIMLDDAASQPGGPGEAKIHFKDDIVYPKDPLALASLLIDPSWLADDEWVRESPSIYRAAWYLTCYDMRGTHGDDVVAAVRDLPSGAREVLDSRVWTTIAPGSNAGDGPSQCVVLSRADATVLAEALGGDITVGTADVFLSGLSGPASQFSVHALMPDGTSGAHGD
jgi:hypothetical protein